MANKIKYGLKNVYYAVATFADNGSASYSTPVAFPGAVNLTLDADGDLTPFYADNIEYWISSGNNGYSGSLEMARVIDSFKKDCLGYVTDGHGALVENFNASAVHFALMFQFEGDEKATRHVMYNCTASRPGSSGQTRGETTEPQTETINLSAKSVYNASLDLDIVKAELTDGVYSTGYEAWFTTVYQPTAPSTST